MRTIDARGKEISRFGDMLRRARTARGITQREIANLIQVGQQAVSRWERGLSRPADARNVEDLIRMFPENSPEDWHLAAGTDARAEKSGERTVGSSRPVRPLLPSLPLDQLSESQFEDFCAQLIHLSLGDAAQVNRYGVPGDSQRGVDIEVHRKDGRYEVFQCKRHSKFGPSKVSATIAALDVQCDQATILLSRRATAAARDAVSPHSLWRLWDSEDISRRVRDLEPSAQRRLVATYFPAFLSEFLGLTNDSALVPIDEHFAPLCSEEKAFSHAWELEGRAEELERLIELGAGNHDDLVLIEGPGGVGKSRLVLALGQALRARSTTVRVLIARRDTRLSQTDEAELLDDRCLVVIEDAHEHASLDQALGWLRSRDVRVVATTRPARSSIVRVAAQRAGFGVPESATVILSPLSIAESADLAEQILRKRGGPVELAGAIAHATSGSSLALVLGSHLVASRRVHPSALNSIEDFRANLMDALRSTVSTTTEQGPARGDVNHLLGLIALLQPVDPASPDFLRLTNDRLSLRADEVQRIIDLLRKNGTVEWRRNSARIIPDLFGEFILEHQCVANGRSTGYFESIIRECSPDQLASILQNVSRLDWRMSSQQPATPRLADVAWNAIDELCQTHTGLRTTLLQAVSSTAYYRPDMAIRFYDNLDQADRHRPEAAELLNSAGHSMDHVVAAAERLWELAKNDNRPLNPHPHHPLRTLKEMAAIVPHKSLEYVGCLAALAMKWIGEDEEGVRAFAILESVLATEGHTTESRSTKLIMRSFGVPPAAVHTIRSKVIDFLIRTLEVERSLAAAAARSLRYALSFPRGALGLRTPPEVKARWTAEFCDTLSKIASRVESSQLDPVVQVELLHAVHWHLAYGDETLRARAQRVADAIPDSLAFSVTLALADGWGHLAERKDSDPHASLLDWREQQRAIANSLVSQHPDPGNAVEFLRSRLDALHESQCDRNGVQFFVEYVAEADSTIAELICSEALLNPENQLTLGFSSALGALFTARRSRAIAIANQALATGRLEFVRWITLALTFAIRRSQSVEPELQDLFRRLLATGDAQTSSIAVPALYWISRVDPEWVLSLVVESDYSDPEVASNLFSLFARDDSGLPIDALTGGQIHRILTSLKKCSELDRHWIENLLGNLSAHYPELIVQFLLDRIRATIQHSTGKYQPLPFDWDQKPVLRIRDTDAMLRCLAIVREYLLEHSESDLISYWGAQLYMAIASEHDGLVETDLTDWIRLGSVEKLRVVTRILAESPGHFVFRRRKFVTWMLEQALAYGDELVEQLRSALWASSISGTRTGQPGSPFPEDEQRLKDAQEAIRNISRFSPAYPLYSAIERYSQREILNCTQDPDR